MKTVVMIALILSLNGLSGMKEDKQDSKEIDLRPYKKLFFEWYGNGPIGTKERWKEFKNGVLEGAIEITPIRQLPEWNNKKYYLAYSKKIQLNNNVVARFMYPSPNNVYSGYPIEDTDEMYTIDWGNRSGPLVNSQIWNTNLGINNAGSIPDQVSPPEKYFSNWKDNPQLWVFWINLKNIIDDPTK